MSRSQVAGHNYLVRECGDAECRRRWRAGEWTTRNAIWAVGGPDLEKARSFLSIRAGYPASAASPADSYCGSLQACDIQEFAEHHATAPCLPERNRKRGWKLAVADWHGATLTVPQPSKSVAIARNNKRISTPFSQFIWNEPACSSRSSNAGRGSEISCSPEFPILRIVSPSGEYCGQLNSAG